MAQLESAFKANLRQRIEALFPGCVILKNDASLQQGIPDMLILWQDRWAMLEVKRSTREKIQPNQPWWVATLNEMSFAAFIYPENQEEVLSALQHAFRP